MKWDQESEQAFQALKEYLASPPLLVKPIPGEELQLYLVVSEAATSRALVKECSDGVQRPVYYVNRALTKSKKELHTLGEAGLCPGNRIKETLALLSSAFCRGYHQPTFE